MKKDIRCTIRWEMVLDAGLDGKRYQMQDQIEKIIRYGIRWKKVFDADRKLDRKNNKMDLEENRYFHTSTNCCINGYFRVH